MEILKKIGAGIKKITSIIGTGVAIGAALYVAGETNKALEKNEVGPKVGEGIRKACGAVKGLFSKKEERPATEEPEAPKAEAEAE